MRSNQERSVEQVPQPDQVLVPLALGGAVPLERAVDLCAAIPW
jgi:hypothetical protein